VNIENHITAATVGSDAAGSPSASVELGHVLRNAKLIDAQGLSVTLEAVRAGRPAVIVLYRGAWCPYCNLALRAYQRDLLPALSSRGIALIAISPQVPDGSLSMQEKNGLTYAVLSDPGNKVAADLGVLTIPAADTRRKLEAMGTDLTELNADGTSAIPMPTVVVVDPAGIIRWIDIHPDYTTRTEVADILSAVSALKLGV
jgi:peroxiredoxin